MDYYELRFWPGWYHHRTLVILAHHFLARLRQPLMRRASSGSRVEPPGMRGGAHQRVGADVLREGEPWPPLAAFPLRLADVRLLLQVALLQPTLDLPAAFALLAYQHQRKGCSTRLAAPKSRCRTNARAPARPHYPLCARPYRALPIAGKPR